MKRILRKNKNKRYLLVIPVVAVVLGAATLAVYAYTKNKSTIINSLQLAGSGVQIEEDSDPGFGKREISFSNTGDNAAVVLLRIAYNETFTKSNGEIASNTAANGTDIVNKTWTADFSYNFRDGHDGWYYYSRVLKPGESVQVLSSISLTDQDYLLYDYDLSFNYEAIQASPEAATELWGKTITINGDLVTWPF